MKTAGPRLVPFFKTVAIFFVLFAEDSKLESFFYCLIKCLPIISLIFFVLLHGMSLSEYYAYSRKIVAGLIFSCLGDAFLVWKNCGYFVHGILMFSVAHVMYAWAFGVKPFDWLTCLICAGIGSVLYMYLLPGLYGVYTYLGFVYMILIMSMAWRAFARISVYRDIPWTKMSSCGGAILFILSDTVIAVDKFRFSVPYAHQIIMLTYYAAQLGIAASVVDSQVDAIMKKTKKDVGATKQVETSNGSVLLNGSGMQNGVITKRKQLET